MYHLEKLIVLLQHEKSEKRRHTYESKNLRISFFFTVFTCIFGDKVAEVGE
jgi:hypothetical protein